MAASSAGAADTPIAAMEQITTATVTDHLRPIMIASGR
jgi:hypothetical protein